MINTLLLATQIFVNGQALDVNVIETNGTFYVPVDAIARALGVEVTIKKDAVHISSPPAAAAVVLPPPPAPAAAPVTGAASTVRPWSEPVPPTGFTAIRGRLTWQQNIFTYPPDRGATVWLVRDDQVTALAQGTGGTTDEPIPTGTAVSFSKDQYPTSVADADGKFGFDNAAPGKYTLIMASKHANGLPARDRQGKVRFKKIVVHPGEIVDASFNFGVTAYKD